MISIYNNLQIYVVLETYKIKLKIEDFIDQILTAGVSYIQLRDKLSSQRDRFDMGVKLKHIIKNINSPCTFIINDSIDIALAVSADGVHLGVKDIPIDIAKQRFPMLQFGYSCNTKTDLDIALKYADYIGIGPCFPTDTKTDLREILSLDELDNFSTSFNKSSFAIGGINSLNISAIKTRSITGVAISSYITSSTTPYDDIQKLLKG